MINRKTLLLKSLLKMLKVKTRFMFRAGMTLIKIMLIKQRRLDNYPMSLVKDMTKKNKMLMQTTMVVSR